MLQIEKMIPPANLQIRAATSDDAFAYAQHMADEAVFSGLLRMPFPTTELWKQRLAAPLRENDLRLVAERDGSVIGVGTLFSVHSTVRRRHVCGLGISVSMSAQGTGVGTALMSALTGYADNWGHVLRIELTVYPDNAAAIALYQKFGFVQEGLHKNYALRAGRYVDSIAMARLHPNPPTLVPFDQPT